MDEKMHELVTIAIPTYKTKYLKEAINSALAQTYENTEILVVNDMSPETGEILSIIDSFSNSKIQYFENDVNLGGKDPANNWDKCLSYAKGDFFCLLCDDDIYEPTFVEEMLNLAKQYPKCNVFRSRCSVIDESGSPHDFYPSSPQWESSEDYMLHVFNGYRRQSISEFLLRTQHVRGLGGYAHLPFAWQADYVSIIKFALSGGITSTNETLVHFRMSGQNISSRSSENGKKKIEANFVAYNMFKEIIYNKPDNILLILCQDKLNEWKYKEDCNVIKFMRFKHIIEMFFCLRKYNIEVKAYLKGLLLSLL